MGGGCIGMQVGKDFVHATVGIGRIIFNGWYKGRLRRIGGIVVRIRMDAHGGFSANSSVLV